MIKKISEKDKKDWEDFINNNQKIPNKDKIIEKNFNKVSKKIDLHGYNLRDANIAVKNLINDAYNLGVEKLIIVTGKGLHSNNEKDPYVSKDLGILKYSIPNFLKNNTELMVLISNISEASIEDGGSGAFYIFLKNK